MSAPDTRRRLVLALVEYVLVAQAEHERRKVAPVQASEPSTSTTSPRAA